MTIAGGGQTSARVYRQTVPFSRSVTARGRRQGDGGRLGPCTRMDDGATTEGDGERAARHLRAACSVYTLRPPPPLRPRQAGATPHPLPCAARALRFATGKGAPFPAPLRSASRATAPARCARQEVAQTGGMGTPAALRFATGRLRAPASKERITRPRVPPSPCRLSAFMGGCVCLPRSSQGRVSLLWWTAGRPRRKGHDTGRLSPAETDCRAPCCSAPRSVSCRGGLASARCFRRGMSLHAAPRARVSRQTASASFSHWFACPFLWWTGRLRFAPLACPRRHRHGRIHAPGWLASRSPVVRPLRGRIRGTAARRQGGFAPPAAALALTPYRRPRP